MNTEITPADRRNMMILNLILFVIALILLAKGFGDWRIASGFGILAIFIKGGRHR